jgi:S2P endopeptidase
MVVLLLPLATILLIFSAFQTNADKQTTPGAEESIHFELLLPGINLPFDEFGYYILSLAVCSFVHEIGHAMCACLEDLNVRGLGFNVLLILPLAYTELDPDQMNALRVWRRLRILCAGIWHNLILAGFSYLLLISLPFLFSSIYSLDNSVIITNMKWHSPLMGAKGNFYLKCCLIINVKKNDFSRFTHWRRDNHNQ